jgi:hypothetical protein
MRVICGFRRDVVICILLGYHAAWNGNYLPTFRDNLSVPYSRVKKCCRLLDPWKMGPISCLKTSVRNDHCTLRDIPEERRYKRKTCVRS